MSHENDPETKRESYEMVGNAIGAVEKPETISMDYQTWFRTKTLLHKLRRMNRKELAKRVDLWDIHWEKHTSKVITLNQQIHQLQHQLSLVTTIVPPTAYIDLTEQT